MRRPALAMAATAWLCAALPSVAAGAPAAPSSDPFYAYRGSLAHVAPGTVLRSRSVTVNGSGLPVPFHGTQLLYRTTNQLGQPDATVATIIQPTVGGATKLLSYQTFYDGVASTCRPSYTLQDGSGSPGIEEGLMASYLAHGYTVLTSDYEGSTDDFGAGREEGQNTLDAIRAAEHALGLPSRTTPVGLVGYSGGSIASQWASELQSAYAPELHLVGIAEGGIPADFTHTLRYIDGSPDWAGAIPAVGIGLARAYRIDFARYLNPYGALVAAKVEKGCIDEAAYPGLTFEKMLKPEYRNWQTVPIFVRIFNDAIMGRTGTPREPLLMRVGDRGDGGDGVMIARDVQQLAYTYCRRGVPVDFQILRGDDHYTAAVPFETAALSFLAARYAGVAPANDCASVGPGNPLTPLPATAGSAIRLRLRGVAVERRARGVAVALSTRGGTAHSVVVELTRNRLVLTTVRLARLTGRRRRVVLSVRRRMPPPGRYVILVFVGQHRVLRAGVTVPGERR